ncbi:endonuclease/exonuclease/phosphatase family protein [Nocardia yamanashiensis]|uniref:endonuclease/exonuclease/phosphatase family protein n=1 Tax=Nocardia yamanashiensis TaxID=209247 RepID=UPI001E607F74|nr:endonuclease/exonuclease/phosphatase family protein [Nocardia yamanashiensis]UGT43945.1 endonuclease/exonuclease/phosphatase family protein [Nocardia yamanashiensis]
MAQAGVLRIAQLNMGSLLEPHWERRRQEILAWFDRLDPDLVCLQEVWEDTAEPGGNTAAWLVDHAPQGHWHWCFGGYPLPFLPDRPTLRFGSAVLSRWPIDRHEVIALPVDPSPPDPHPSWTMQAELLYARTGGADVFSTHLAPPPAQAYQRVRQVLAIDEAIRARHDPATTPLPPILCGDFNAKPESDEMRFLNANAVIEGRSTHYVDAWSTLRPGEAGRTMDPLTNPQARFLNVPPQRIDYVLVGDPFLRPEGAGRLLEVDLAFCEPLTGILASDHYGLVADVRWPQKPAR